MQSLWRNTNPYNRPCLRTAVVAIWVVTFTWELEPVERNPRGEYEEDPDAPHELDEAAQKPAHIWNQEFWVR